MLGFSTSQDALECYKSAYNDGQKRVGGVTRMSIERLKEWLRAGDVTLPLRRMTGGVKAVG
jgi:hypothetical protein